MLITDAQVHLWEVDRPERPWPQPPRNKPQLPNGFSAAQMITEMDAIGVDRAVIVPPTWVGENNATALEAARDYPGRFGVMGRFDAAAPDARDQLANWRSQPGMLGIRLTFRIEPFATMLAEGSFEWVWTACEQHGIPLMLLLPEQLERVAPIAERHPGLTIVIDHMACFVGKTGAEAFARFPDLMELARFSNVRVKTSSAPCFSVEEYPFRDIEPYLRRIYEFFGPRRMLWGSDLTRLRGSYADCLRHFQEGLDFLSPTDRDWILGRAAAEALGWPE